MLEISSKIKHIGNLDEIFQKFNLCVPQGAKKIIEIFERNNSQILIPGGFVRDIILQKIPRDIDFATDLNPEQIQKLLEKELSGQYKKLELQGKTFGVIRIVLSDNENYEIATFRKDGKYSDGIHPDNIELISSAQEDAKRRDFTINALFYNPINGNIIDYIGGLNDLENKKLKFVGNANKRIEEDKSRMLRYARFLIYTNFSPDKCNEEIIKNHSHEINNIPSELIKKELDKILQISNGKIFLEILDKLDLLENIIPEIKNLEKCEQSAPYHMEGNVLTHTKMVCENLPENSDLILKWTGIFHDIGKPETIQKFIKDKKYRISFINHDKIGAEKAKAILKRLKFSKHEIKQITWFIKNHFTVRQEYFNFLEKFSDITAKEKITRSLKRLIFQTSEKTISDLMNLAFADIKGSISHGDNKDEKYMSVIFECLDNAKNIIKIENEKKINIEKLISGKIIMKKLGLKQGQEIGNIKNQIIEELSQQSFDSLKEAKIAFRNILERIKKKKT